ncbi:putative chromosome segregation protein SudA [Gaertneriomyces semiglobifer]|nr:putative chromosome segregation protein SudA [Gaertneriomyces semiglobifer]
MYIKQIIIQGFKSYKDQTALEPFSPHLNVVVGRNGSGKSNFFWAIRFVLSDAYTNMTREERQSLLHEGTGPPTLSAFVEIVFDNTDQRFPTGKDKLVLRRTIGLKKDEYSLDKKSVTRTEVMSLLESAGFSRSNPYYIVPQGKITALTNAKDAERLQLLKEVAGTRVYEQRRAESLKIMEETESKQKKIDEHLQHIEERLTELEEEKEELKKFQETDRERRCLEYTIYQRELEEMNAQLEELEEARRNEVDESNQKQNVFNDRQRILADLEKQIRDLKQQQGQLAAERVQLDDERQEQIKAKAHLELVVRDMEERATTSVDEKSQVQSELEMLKQKIAEKESELDTIRPEFELAVREEERIKEAFETTNVEYTSLLSKQTRNTQFSSKRDRDTFLRQQIAQAQSSIQSDNASMETLQKEVENAKRRTQELENEQERLRQGVEEAKGSVRDLDQEIVAKRRERVVLDERRKELWREESKMSVALQTAKDDVETSERRLYGTMDRVTGDGLRAIQRIIKRHNIPGVYGPLYQLFTFDERYRPAVETIAGSSLFHIVIDNDTTATILLEHLKKEKSGRVTFMPLNRLHPKLPSYPQSNDCVVLLRKLQFDARYGPAMEQVFGRAVVCPNLEVASGYARQQGLNAVTLFGDRADRKGALTGGYHDNTTSRLEIVKRLQTARETMEESEGRIGVVRKELDVVEQSVTKCRDELGMLEVRKRRGVEGREDEVKMITILEREREGVLKRLERNEAALRNLSMNVKSMTVQLRVLEEELSGPFVPGDPTEVEALRERVDTLRNELADASKVRAGVESRKMIVEVALSSNLRKRLLECEARLNELRDGAEAGQNVLIEGRKEELIRLDAHLERIESRLAEIDQQLEDITSQLSSATSELESTQQTQTSLQKNLQKHMITTQKVAAKKHTLFTRKSTILQSIRDLGALPSSIPSYTSTSTKTLLNKLHHINTTLSSLPPVNKKALEQYQQFTREKEKLEERREEQEKAGEAIMELVRSLDMRKDEVIERTFRDVRDQFAKVWGWLVPGCAGELRIIRRLDSDLGTQTQNENESESGTDTSQYQGISLHVTFTPGTQPLQVSQLSGGQKSLVALALIFAIQMCDPAPFYLFDEIDAALDSVYRSAVARVVKMLSRGGGSSATENEGENENESGDESDVEGSGINAVKRGAQFIVTTFRPEMVEVGDQFYGVTFVGKVSRVVSIGREDALGFVEEVAGGASVGR